MLRIRPHCDFGRDLDELDELFIPTLRSILALGNECNYERVLDVAVYQELGWSDIDGVGLPALLHFLHNTPPNGCRPHPAYSLTP